MDWGGKNYTGMTKVYDIDDSLTIWVGDLDAWINVDFSVEYEEERRIEALENDLAEIGDIALLSGKFISSRTLLSRGITPDRWRWFLHEAEVALKDATSQNEIEPLFVKDISKLGQNYAIGRYARWENLPYEAAATAIYPNGIRALLYQYFSSEKILRESNYRPRVIKAIKDALEDKELIAYYRTRFIQTAIHQLANADGNPKGHVALDKNNIRNILSLCRLHFASMECKVSSLLQLHEVTLRYKQARNLVSQGGAPKQAAPGGEISNWELRHLHTLTYFYPYSIRNCFLRSVKQINEDPNAFTRDKAANELALARCEMKLMKQKSIDRRKAK